MLRAPGAEEHAGTPPDGWQHWQRLTDGPSAPGRARRPPSPVLTGPPGPVHPAPRLAPSGGDGGGV